MTILVTLLVAMLVAGGAYYGLVIRPKQQKQLPQAQQLKLLEQRTSPMGLQVDDIVVYYDKEYMVAGKLTYSEEGWSWLEFMLVDGDEVAWLTVEQDDQLEVSFSDEIKELALSGPPGAELTHEGTRYVLKEKGRAKMTREGQTGKKSHEICSYFEFVGPSGETLSVEQWGQSFDVYKNRPISAHELDILPAS